MYEKLDMFSKTMFVGEGIIGILSYFNAENGIPVPTPSLPRAQSMSLHVAEWRRVVERRGRVYGAFREEQTAGSPPEAGVHGPGNIRV